MLASKAANASYSEATSIIYQLARDLRDEGVGQVALHQIFTDGLRSLDPDDALYDALTDTLDEIWGGGWAKGGGLYQEELSEARLCHSGLK